MVKRLLGGVVLVREGSYCPFDLVEQQKLMRLTDFVYCDRVDESLSEARVDFYLQLMTPKQDWIRERFGWLNDKHMTSGMNLFRQRSQKKLTPFKHTRISFLDPLFANVWCTQYVRDFVGKEKKWVFSKAYADLFNGLIPTFAATEKKWVQDVDTLYIPHNIQNMHWVALEVDLLKQRIKNL